jgi:surface protein
MKIKILSLSLLFGCNLFASDYLVTLDNKHYDSYVNVVDYVKADDAESSAYPKCDQGQEQISYDDLRAMIVAGADVTNVCTSGITSMSYLFSRKPVNGDISGWDVSNVTDMSYLFTETAGFSQNIDMSGWDTRKVTNIEGLLHNSGATVDVSNWDVSNVTNAAYVFYNAPTFSGDISKWNMSSATTMTQMFYQARSFNSDISGWDVSNVTNMHYMFYHADAFTQDLSTWNVNKVTSYSEFNRYSQMSGTPTFQ